MNERVKYAGVAPSSRLLRLEEIATIIIDDRVPFGRGEDVMDLPHGERISLSELSKAEKARL